MAKPIEQISVKLDPDLRAAMESVARAEDRTLSGQIRHVLAESVRRRQQPAEHAA